MTIEEWLGPENTLGVDIWKSKYQNEDESFEEWLDRVSAGDPEIRELIRQKKFLFGGRILANRGMARKRKITYSNCYVTDTGDSIEEIFDTAKKIARTFSYGGGIGVDITPLAPRGATVHNAAKTSTGAVSFMDLYSLVTGLIGQSGRRGALMISMSCDHPDIEEFIDVKNDLDRVNFANISVRVTDKFMEAVEKDEDFTLYFRRQETGEEIRRTIRARELFRKLAENNWRTGEPGILFWDRISNYNLLNTTPGFSYAGTNPCGEEPLPTGGSCLLGSVNLSEFVLEPFTENAQFDFDGFAGAVGACVKALNGVLDEGEGLHPLGEQRDCVRRWRQIGLGYMGIADAMLKLGIRYGSGESLRFISEVGMTMAKQALLTSAYVGLMGGKGSYDAFDREAVLSSAFYRAVAADDPEVDEVFRSAGALRNSQLMTVAPTGTLSTMLGISGGIEPIFANYYTRTTKSIHDKDVTYKVYTPIVKAYMEANGITDDAELPDYFVTAQTIPYQERVAVQAAMQQYIDASISSTVNLPNSATVEDIENLYLLAWKLGCKGITVFRDGCERAGILNAGGGDGEEEAPAPLRRGFVKKVGNDAVGLERHLTTGCGSLHCSAFFDRETGELLETYLSKGSAGGCLSSLTGLSRMISLAARGGIDVDRITDQLKSSVTCPSYAVRKAVRGDTSTGNCCPAAVGNALLDMHREFMDKYIQNGAQKGKGTGSSPAEEAPKPAEDRLKRAEADNACPLCGEELVFEGGCATCRACGWSRCG